MHFVRKSTCLALVLAIFAAFPAQAEFKGVLDTPATQTHLAAQRPLNAVAAAGARLVAVGLRGHIVYSDDHGNSWEQAAVPVSSDLTAVFFSSERSGWAVGHDGVVLHSDDAGQSWQLQLDGHRADTLIKDYYGKKARQGDAQAAALLPDIELYFSSGADKPFLDLWFANDEVGFVVGAFNMILRTDNGGKSWTPWFDRIDNPLRLHLYSIRGQGEQVYIAGELGLVAVLDRDTQYFQAIPVPYTGSFFGVLPVASGAVVHGMRGNAFRFDENGANWQKLDTGVLGGLTGAAMLDRNRLALVSTAGDILIGKLSSGRFENLTATRGMLFAGVAFVPATKSLALVGNNGAAVVPLIEQ
ncbi:WD40/YVTN/BNR-like repeat-containing protein [Zobellella sp. An-6]|uniref:WD40/YVTN/BNR-like repeat-containing protein n=1 Tax=Zobellella sp. An-6 TaxID=3400218 RepID=UPI0040416CFC